MIGRNVDVEKLQKALRAIHHWWLHEEGATRDTFPANDLQDAHQAVNALDIIAPVEKKK